MAPDILGGGFGKIGVMIFFVLSAFLMTRLYLDRSFDEAWRGYVTARAGRVFPLYLLLVVLALPATYLYPAWRYEISGLWELAQHLLFFKASNEMWAIPVEVQFYLVFIAFWGISERWPFLRSGGGLAAALAMMWLPLFGATVLLKPEFNTLGHAMIFFLIGIVLAIYDTKIASRFPAVLGGWGAIILAAILLVACTPELRKATGTYVPLWIDPVILFSVTLIFLMVRHGRTLATLLNTHIMQFLGRISYGVYLIHSIVLYAVSSQLGGHSPLLGLFVVTATTLIVSALSFRYFETPMARLIRKRQTQPSAPSPMDSTSHS